MAGNDIRERHEGPREHHHLGITEGALRHALGLGVLYYIEAERARRMS